MPQSDVPSRRVLSDARLYGRREGVFFVLVSAFVVAVAAMPLLGSTRLFDLHRVLPSLHLPIALLVPVGALTFPLTLLALNLVGELYGPRRSAALAFMSLLVNLGVIGLVRVADLIPGPGGAGIERFSSSVAYAACGAAAHIVTMQVFGAMLSLLGRRRLGLRHAFSVLVGQVIGWGGFMVISFAFAQSAGAVDANLVAQSNLSIAAAAAGYTVAGALVGTLALYPLARGLAIYMRVPRSRSLASRRRASADDFEPRWAIGTAPAARASVRSPVQSAPVVLAPNPPAPPPARRTALGTEQPVEPSSQSGVSRPAAAVGSRWDEQRPRSFSRAEEAFFNAGEELESSAADSFSDLN